jgi:hypothetical protein
VRDALEMLKLVREKTLEECNHLCKARIVTDANGHSFKEIIKNLDKDSIEI